MVNRFSRLKEDVVYLFQNGAWQKKAVNCLTDKTKMKTLLSLVLRLFKQRALGPVLKDLILLYFYVTDIINGRYHDFRKSRLILIVAVLIYVVSPFDLIPDFIAGVGFLDDAALISYIIRMSDKELSRYYKWNRRQRDSQSVTEKV